MAVILLILGLILFIGLVVVHEFGHFVEARRGGVEVEEFGIGFPPRAWKKRIKSPKGHFNFTLNWLPLGGFVKLKGENDEDKRPGSFGAAPLGTKVKIMLAGVVMNLLTALVLFMIVGLIGMPQLPKELLPNQFTVKGNEHVVKDVDNKGVLLVGQVIKDTPASRADLKNDDEIISIDGQPIDSHEDLASLTRSKPASNVSVVIKRNDQLLTKEVKLNSTELAKTQGYLGVQTRSGQSGMKFVRYTWAAPIVAVGTTKQLTEVTFKGLGKALKGLGSIFAGLFTGNQAARQDGHERATKDIGGPLAIFFVLRDGSELGIAFVLFIIALISLTLAIMNVLPIPALDGGRLFVTLLFRAARKPLHQKTEELIHGSGFAILMILFVLITIVDVRRFF
ncbi:MAG: M50 family metallopeptidase [Patescibacteria group bacterium]